MPSSWAVPTHCAPLGAGIGDKRWSNSYKREILDSRVKSTKLLASVIAGAARRPSVFLSGSAIGFYGARGDEVLDETSAAGSGFLADVCREWEAAAVGAGTRTVFLRTGIVLSPKGGALKKQLPLFRAGLGGKFGRGDQWQSWISIDDEVAAISHLLASDVHGPVNLTAPAAVTNATLRRCSARCCTARRCCPCRRSDRSCCLVRNSLMRCSSPASA